MTSFVTHYCCASLRAKTPQWTTDGEFMNLDRFRLRVIKNTGAGNKFTLPQRTHLALPGETIYFDQMIEDDSVIDTALCDLYPNDEPILLPNINNVFKKRKHSVLSIRTDPLYLEFQKLVEQATQ